MSDGVGGENGGCLHATHAINVWDCDVHAEGLSMSSPGLIPSLLVYFEFYSPRVTCHVIR